ncbi:MAG: V-type ATPase 116kDa subunit family protein, partial [Mariprofundaceae bacterium]|nr:V-type ATPase 116kDa subunit family protein [Mariprofundaceae bacterium]
LATSLQLLADTHLFHLSEHDHLGRAENLDTLKQLYEARNRYRRLHAIRKQLQDRLPLQPLLQYRVGEAPHKASLPTGTVRTEEGAFLWAGEKPPEEIEALAEDVDKEPEPLPMELTDEQWRLLFATERAIGRIQAWAVIDGWIPAAEQQRFRRLLDGEAVAIISAEESELPLREVPVRFSRPRFLDGFAALMRMFGVSGYREIDPAPVLGIGFVMMFGLMFADLGQGLLMFALGLWLAWYGWRSVGNFWRRTGQVMAPIGLSSAFFGAMFGNCFAHEDWIPALWFHPMDHILFYLAASIVIGMVTICAGMIFGMINAWRTRRWREVAWDDFGPVGFCFYLALILLAVGLATERAVAEWIGAGLALCGLLAMGMHHFLASRQENPVMRCFLTIIEIYDFCLKFLVQTMSFVRIAAFTVAHIALSTVLLLAVDALSSSPWAAWSVFIIGNFAIIVIEGLLVTIQVIRLHFFEFFTKFVAGQGKLFRPLSAPGEATT